MVSATISLPIPPFQFQSFFWEWERYTGAGNRFYIKYFLSWKSMDILDFHPERLCFEVFLVWIVSACLFTLETPLSPPPSPIPLLIFSFPSFPFISHSSTFPSHLLFHPLLLPCPFSRILSTSISYTKLHYDQSFQNISHLGFLGESSCSSKITRDSSYFKSSLVLHLRRLMHLVSRHVKWVCCYKPGQSAFVWSPGLINEETQQGWEAVRWCLHDAQGLNTMSFFSCTVQVHF